MKHLNLCLKEIASDLLVFSLAAALLLSGCDTSTSADESEIQIVDALIELDGASEEATIEVGNTVKFSGFALTKSGDRVPLAELGENWSWEWESSDTAVFTVDDEGNANGQEEGEAYCVITLYGPDDGTESNSIKQETLLTTDSNPGLPEMARIFVGRDSLSVTFLN
ncbi:hypothetical protein LQ318_00130 [Aliifodinibius salicampi]|uniref:BIG2 domain-containing protein n=1 Tax=Fodinibius salicampi TaxID=1920655 RepID=A0ABT3PTW3_9BACT|nr:hypothetical protein [Fodinibius salicampi]MCW9711296.1 hypothetical protein [Fodinibius salicampi]